MFSNKIYNFWAFLSLILIISSCKSGDGSPDVSHIDVKIQVNRIDQNSFNISNKEDFDRLISRYSSFFNIYLDNVLNLIPDTDSSFYDSFTGVMSDSLMQDIHKKTSTRYEDMADIESDLKRMYQYLFYYFPDRVEIPNIYTFIADFAYQIFIFDDNGQDGIGIGLDMFLTPEVNYKMINPDNTNFSDYITRSWNQDHIIGKVAQMHVNDLAGDSPGQRMIDQMVHNGKVLYITKNILPFVHDTIIHEFTLDQWVWCQNNQFEMWQFFLENKLFYETNLKKISKYIFPAPTSLDMPPTSPGRTANFIGFKIVESYMKQHPETTLQDLIAITDSQLLMEKSKYKPRLK